MIDWQASFATCIEFLQRYYQYAQLVCPADVPKLPIEFECSAPKPYCKSINSRKFDPMLMAQAANLLDQAAGHYGSLKFSNSLLAASAFSIFCPVPQFEQQSVIKWVTGYSWEQISESRLFLRDFEQQDVVAIIMERMKGAIDSYKGSELGPFDIASDQIACCLVEE